MNHAQFEQEHVLLYETKLFKASYCNLLSVKKIIIEQVYKLSVTTVR